MLKTRTTSRVRFPPWEQAPVSHLSLPMVAEWSRRLGSAITFFDLETTTKFIGATRFGVTEVATLQIEPGGAIVARTGLVDPECGIDREVTRLTGIAAADVAGRPTWAAGWGSECHVLAADHLTVAFYSRSFDCPAVCLMNQRHLGIDTIFERHLDLHTIAGVKGKLGEVAREMNILPVRSHRAMDDVLTTALVLDRLLVQRGFEEFSAAIRRFPQSGVWQMWTARAERRSVLLRGCRSGVPVDLDQLAHEFCIKRSTLEGDLMDLIEAGQVETDPFENPAVQTCLTLHLPPALAASGPERRLKPLMEMLAPECPGLDYFQLRIAIRRLARE